MQNKHVGTKIATANDYICIPLTNAWNVYQSRILRTRCIVCICCGELEGVVVVMQFQYLSLPSSVL